MCEDCADPPEQIHSSPTPLLWTSAVPGAAGVSAPCTGSGGGEEGLETMAVAAVTVQPSPPPQGQEQEQGEQLSSESLKPQQVATAPPSPDTVVVNVAGTKYSVVTLIADELGMTVTGENSDDCDLFWTDTGLPTEKFLGLKHYQYVNHFPGMVEISRKDSLGRNMERLRKLHKEEYNFVPRTWVLPSDYHSLSYHMRELKRKRKHKTFIIKPHNSAMGNGISLTRSVDDIHKEQNVVVQEYLDKPFLLDGFKIDLRVYVLVTCCNPLRVFVYRDGLVRFSTQHYIPPSDSNLGKHFMHLTNYSINKHSDTFDNSEAVDRGSKRTLQFLNTWLTEHEYNVPELWAKIHDIIVKTMLVTSPHLVHSYQACRPGRTQEEKSQFFEILGFDIFLDDQLTPWLLEVNRAPSFATDSKLDLDIKSGVLRDALKIFNIKPCNKKKEMVAHRIAVRRRLVSPNKCSRYDFLAEQEGASLELERKKKEVKDRLERIRRERDELEHEYQSMGGYTRVYPCGDWAKEKLYKSLLKSASAITVIGEKGPGRCASPKDSLINKMKEHELLDLLSQYEDEDKSGTGGYLTLPSSSSSTSYQPLSIESHSPMDAVYRAMATRMAEEEQTQRIMIVLNEMKPTYPGKTSKELKMVLEEIDSAMEHHTSNLANFWLDTLDGKQRRQLLYPLRHSLSDLLCCYWRTEVLEGIRLYQIFKKLFNFLLSNHGKGLWSCFVPKEKTWEALFRARSNVISVIEMVCCRRIVELIKATVKAAFYYHHLRHSSLTKAKQRSVPPSKAHSPSTSITNSPTRVLPAIGSKPPTATSLLLSLRSHPYNHGHVRAAGVPASLSHTHHSAAVVAATTQAYQISKRKSAPRFPGKL